MDIRAKRIAKGYTQKQLADLVGSTQTAISLIESKERKPSINMAQRIGKALGFPWPEIYEEDNDDDEKTIP